MHELLGLAPLPPDVISLNSGGLFQGSAYVYKRTPSDSDGHSTVGPVEVKFIVPKGKPLKPFIYKKPIEDQHNPFASPVRFDSDKKPRDGYFPVAFVKDSMRAPNHLFESDSAIVASVNAGTEDRPKWETRYFPSKSLDSNTWRDALRLLGIIEIRSENGLILRQYVPDDAQEAFDLIKRNKVHLSNFGESTGNAYSDAEAFRVSIVHPANPKRLRLGIRNADGLYMGTINITPDKDNGQRGQIGYYIGSEFQGKGFQTEAVKTLTDFAFEELGFNELYANTAPANEKSQNVLLRAGYNEETGFNEKNEAVFTLKKAA